jgi:hypothetical protein
VTGSARTRIRLLAVASFAVAGAVAAPAAAEPMDPALERLVLDERCHDRTENNPQAFGHFNESTVDRFDLLQKTGRDTCAPDHLAFKRLMSQWGFAFAPSAMHSARTTGFGGFHLSIEGQFTTIDDGASYWKLGTQGPHDPSSGKASVINSSPASMLSLYSAKIRKSFGFGLELTGQVGFMPKTSIISGGADVRMSLLEGFRLGVGGILPDFAVGGGVRTITGTPQFQLTVAALDLQISKPLPIQDSSVITPWIGYQYAWIFADSGLIDTTPATDPIGYCGFSGPNVPGNPDLGRDDKNPSLPGGIPDSADQVYDGQPVCDEGSPLDFNNNVVFNKARLERQRLIFGLAYRYENAMIGGQFITDIVDPADAQNSDDDARALEGEDRQWTLVFELGGMF